MHTTVASSLPEQGQIVTTRQRRYVVTEIQKSALPTGTLVERTSAQRNIQDGRLIFDGFKYLFLDENERGTLLLEPGDILVNRTNSAELVGKCAVFDVDGEYSFASYIIRLRLDSRRALPELVAHYINSPFGRDYMFRERKQMTGQANINSAKLKAFPLALPEIGIQHRLLSYLEQVQERLNRLKRLQAESAAELDALLPSILDRAFRGEL